jgi:AhpD family alkylhydroperoxidase
MIKIGASQINGCAYCVNLHTKEARKLGETEQRIYLMSVCREAPNIFSDEKLLLLEMPEEITLINQHGFSDRLYEKAISLWAEESMAHVMSYFVRSPLTKVITRDNFIN